MTVRRIAAEIKQRAESLTYEVSMNYELKTCLTRAYSAHLGFLIFITTV